jgi:catalase
MHGFGSHTYSLINKNNEKVWLKFHFITQQGIQNFTDESATEMKGKDADHAQRDLVEAIGNKDFPKWVLKIQVMTEEQAKSFRWNPFDLTKIWPHAEFPLIDVGVMELNEIPSNYFRDVEQSAFAPAHVIDGISYSPDKMLQGRILSYPDAHRYRLGVNYEHLPVNKCPFMVANYQRDGSMQVSDNGNDNPNYRPNSFDDIVADETYKEPPMQMDSIVADWYDRNENDNDHYTQPGNLYRKVLNDEEKKNLVKNVLGSMRGITGPRKDEIINRQLCHFFRADIGLGLAIANGLGVTVDEKSMAHAEA